MLLSGGRDRTYKPGSHQQPAWKGDDTYIHTGKIGKIYDSMDPLLFQK
jgi:hypothetical protein